jgi:hypothetical protein
MAPDAFEQSVKLHHRSRAAVARAAEAILNGARQGCIAAQRAANEYRRRRDQAIRC